MARNDSLIVFIDTLNDRLNDLRQSLSTFLQHLSLDDRAKKIETANDLLGRIEVLKSIVSNRHRPKWVHPLEEKLRWYVGAATSRDDAGLEILQTILGVNTAIQTQQWDYLESSSPDGIDFDEIYEEYYRSSRIPELFDELLRQLQAIIDSDQITNVKVLRALEKLIATIKRNSAKGFFSARWTWIFAYKSITNTLWELPEEVPILKSMVRGVKKTLAEMEKEFDDCNNKVGQHLIEVSDFDFPLNQYMPPLLIASDEDLNGAVDDESDIS